MFFRFLKVIDDLSAATVRAMHLATEDYGGRDLGPGLKPEAQPARAAGQWQFAAQRDQLSKSWLNLLNGQHLEILMQQALQPSFIIASPAVA